MSKDENIPESGRKGQAQAELALAPSEGWSADPKLSASLLTIENVKKLQEEYPVAKSSLARQSIEVYLQQSNLIVEENEASRKEPNLPNEEELEAVSDHDITDRCHLGYCEFCAAALKPFPTAEELENDPAKMGTLPCCRTYREILQCVLQELMEAQSPGSTIDITPHPRLSQILLNSKTKSFLMEELQERGFENYKEVFEQYMKLGTCVKLVFKISNYPPKPKPIAVKKRPQPKDLLKIDVEFKPKHLKLCHPINPVKRYYPDGKIFFLLLPDGTGQVYYPSGNIAVLITYLKDVQFSYIVLADSPYNGLVAFFTNQGYAACYYPDRSIRVNLDLCCGSSYDQKGFQQKRWNWWDLSDHVHAPPFQPIVMKLNIYIQVKIEAQDQISLTFTKLHNCILLNVGARLKLKDPAMLPFLKPEKSQKPFVSRSKIVKIQTLLDKLHKELEAMHNIAPSEPTVHIDVIILIINRIKRWKNSMLNKRRK
ncbi:glutamate-rich protein 6B-like [Eublepharis macularius]|uniref:Glutamate-rich protein 6B-like n=1 Tax=Eublepharis macularius TaxID=481883 RepID=A0AA97L2J5_EUBMA|nr:glutamate-rich protein 6B-like [Eublepharis macularius]